MSGEIICYKNLIRPALANAEPTSILKFNEKVNKLKESGRKINHFGFGQSPFPVPNCLQDALKEFAHVNDYLSMSGLKSLREQLVIYHQLCDDVDLNEDNFIVAPGSKELLYLTITNFNGVVLIPTPAWPAYHHQCELAGIETVKIATNEAESWKISTEAIEKVCQDLKQKNKLLIFTNPGNPTGQCYTEEEIVKISEICKRECVIVASDEIYGRIALSKQHFCMVKYYPEGTILFSGFSKCLSIGGWRTGHAYFPPTLKELLKAVNSSASHTYTCAPAPMQYALEKCLREKYDELERYQRNCCSILKIVGEFCHRELLSVGVGGKQIEAGYHFLPNFEVIRVGLYKRGILTGKQMAHFMLEDIGVAIISAEPFGCPESDLFARLSIVCFDGNLSLKNLNKLTDGSLSEDEFVRLFCPELYEGIQNIKTWVLQHSN